MRGSMAIEEKIYEPDVSLMEGELRGEGSTTVHDAPMHAAHADAPGGGMARAGHGSKQAQEGNKGGSHRHVAAFVTQRQDRRCKHS